MRGSERIITDLAELSFEEMLEITFSETLSSNSISRKSCLNYLEKCLITKIDNKEDISSQVKQLAIASTKWAELNQKDKNFLKLIDNLFSQIVFRYGCYGNEAHNASSLVNFILNFYNESSIAVRRAIIDVIFAKSANKSRIFSFEKISQSAELSNFIVQALYSNCQNDVNLSEIPSHPVIPFESLKDKIWYIEKLRENLFYAGGDFANYLSKQLIESVLEKLNEKDKNLMEEELNYFFETEFFINNIYPLLVVPQHLNILTHINDYYPELFKGYVDYKLQLPSDHIYDYLESPVFLTLLEINSEVFFECLKLQKYRSFREDSKTYVLVSCLQQYQTKITDFDKYMDFVNLLYTKFFCNDKNWQNSYFTRKIQMFIVESDECFSVRRNSENLLKLIEKNSWILQTELWNTYYKSIASSIVYSYSYQFSENHAELASSILVPLSEVLTEKEVTEVILTLLDRFQPEAVVQSNELCWFIAKALCYIGKGSPHDKLEPVDESLITQCSNLRNVKNNRQFDKYLLYIRYSFYPHIENTILAEIMDKGRTYSSKSTIGAAFASMAKNSDNPFIINWNTSLSKKNEMDVENIWSYMQSCKPKTFRLFSLSSQHLEVPSAPSTLEKKAIPHESKNSLPDVEVIEMTEELPFAVAELVDAEPSAPPLAEAIALGAEEQVNSEQQPLPSAPPGKDEEEETFVRKLAR